MKVTKDKVLSKVQSLPFYLVLRKNWYVVAGVFVLLIVICMFGSCGGGDGSEEFRKAYDYALEGNDKKVDKYFLKSAEKGYAKAQFAVGDDYLKNGKTKEGLKWLEKAAKQGDNWHWAIITRKRRTMTKPLNTTRRLRSSEAPAERESSKTCSPN